MKRDRSRGLVIGVLVVLFAACSGEGSAPLAGGHREGDGSGQRMMVESAEARARVVDLRQRFRWAVRARPDGDPLHGLEQDMPSAPVPVIGAGVVEAFEPAAAGRVRVHVSEAARRGVSKPARVELPARASDPVHLEDETSGMAIEFALEGARDAEIAVGDGMAFYEAALPNGADVVHRVSAEGTEDYVVFERKPDREELVYRVDVSQVAGLRLVEDTLEFLDGEGTPRLRVAPPYVVDAVGKGHAAHVAVSGCAVDKDPRAPWGRAVTAPGAGAGLCRVRVTWGDLTYPAVVDPVWMPVGSMATDRNSHTASALSSGKVLVAGGFKSNMVLSSAELYDPGTKTWSAAKNLGTARAGHTATALWSANILVAGGTDGTMSLKSAELYEPTDGKWKLVGQMTTGRSYHTATLLPSAMVLVVGGAPGNLLSAEQYSPTFEFWISAVPMATGRSHHTATLLPSKKVLVAGGLSGGIGVSVSSAELYDYSMGGTWSSAQPMATKRANHTATVLKSGKVLVAGGSSGGANIEWSAELYDYQANSWIFTDHMTVKRMNHTASLLPSSGKVLVAGGDNFGKFPLQSAELYDPMVNNWSPETNMTTARARHTATLLPLSDKILVAGGFSGVNPLSAELYLVMTGSPCSSSTDCQSGFCADGVCCNTACNAGPCDACSTATGALSNGTCALFTGPACNDGNACTKPDTCQAGVCTGANPVVCWDVGQCHDQGTCDTATGLCFNPARPNGTLCDDGDKCTSADTCQSGICAGKTVTCTARDECHEAGTCGLGSGACSNPTKQDGAPCTDGTCQGGVCTSRSNGATDFYACAASGSPAPASPAGPAWLSALLFLAAARKRSSRSARARGSLTSS